MMFSQKYSKVWLALIFSVLTVNVQASEQELLVSLRMIGHEMLLKAGDSNARVLPIVKEGDAYKMVFESELEFDPNLLIHTFDSVMKMNAHTQGYIVEVKSCDSNYVVHSFKIGQTKEQDVIPCRGRILPKDCYAIFFTPGFDFFAETTQATLPAVSVKEQDENSQTNWWIWLLLPLIGLAIYFGWNAKPKRENQMSEPENPNVFAIGSFHFDRRNMQLSRNGEQLELSNKEAELLFVLLDSANETVEREKILKEVWGDDGDYVGRTLDVFISKLRKKLEPDTNIKIANIRGVGYRLILNG